MAKNMAILDNDNIVEKILWFSDYMPEDDNRKNIIGDVYIGDAYNSTDKRFYRDGEMVLTETEQKLADAEAALAVLGVSE